MIAIDQERIRDLVSRPSETLNVEVKRWLDLDSDQGVAKVVQAAFALRNRNGGFLVFGFDNKTLQPHDADRPSDVRAAFHVDEVQGIISRYASESFEIAVGFHEREGKEYAVIAVDDGFTVPVFVKRDLIGDGGKKLLTVGDLYVRTLNANGTPSTARARPEDWREILEFCFENREADIGRFLRRHLAGQDIRTLLSALGQFAADTPSGPTLRERSKALLIFGEQRFNAALENRAVSERERRVLDAGRWSVAVVIEPPKDAAIPDQTFLNTAMSSNPAYTGWPVWIDSRFFMDETARPTVSDDAWEAFIISPVDHGADHLDFWRLDPKGQLYLLRNLQDDVVANVEPRSVLDFALVLWRVTEALAVALALARALGWDPATTKLGFAFRWTKLRGRQLRCWSDPFAVIGGGTARDDEIATTVELNLDTPPHALAPAVNEATQRLFALFDGAEIPLPVIEDIVRRVITRRR